MISIQQRTPAILITAPQHRYFIVNKPDGMLSQFKSERAGIDLLGQIDFDFPEGAHAIGRLDRQSEGLLIITTNKNVTQLLFQGKTLHKRTYLVKVKNTLDKEKLRQLQNGINIRVEGGGYYTTAACEAEIIDEPGELFQQSNALPDYPPYTWIKMSLTEGKYRQIRKMTGAIHHRCRRLIRVAIEDLELGNLAPGLVKEIPENDFFDLLKIDNWK